MHAELNVYGQILAVAEDPLGPCPFSKLMVDIIDKYGVRWCIFE